MSLYCGIDLHSNNCYLCYLAVLDEQLRSVLGRRVANSVETILAALEPSQEQLVAVAVESTFNWYWLVDGLMEAGYHVELVNTSAVRQYESLKYVYDRHDARWLARLLQLGSDALKTEIASLEKTILAQARQRPEYAFLESITGIGQTLAMTILYETGSLSRFPDAGHFCSHCRCVPSQHFSNGKVKGKGNTWNGNPYLSGPK